MRKRQKRKRKERNRWKQQMQRKKRLKRSQNQGYQKMLTRELQKRKSLGAKTNRAFYSKKRTTDRIRTLGTNS